MGYMVPIDDVVVPVALAGLEGGGLEPECALPGLGGRLVLGKGELADVVVPRAEEMDGLDAGGDAEGEAELSGRHFERIGVIKLFFETKRLVLMVYEIDILNRRFFESLGEQVESKRYPLLDGGELGGESNWKMQVKSVCVK